MVRSVSQILIFFFINSNVRLLIKGNYAAIYEELERNNWESMFESQTIDQCYGTFLNVTNIIVEL